MENKHSKNRVKEYIADRSGVFGLGSVQTFFAIILSVALLAYVIVVIMGTLQDSTILVQDTAKVVNETGTVNASGYTLSKASVAGFSNPVIVAVINASSNGTVTAANYTVSSTGVVTNASAIHWNSAKITYTYNLDSTAQLNSKAILTNTSTGISGFFSSVNPVYAILAILVIILVLVVLVRVVSGRSSSGDSGSVAL